MPERLTSAYWREQAPKARELADHRSDKNIREAMLEVAADCDEPATCIDRPEAYRRTHCGIQQVAVGIYLQLVAAPGGLLREP